MKYQCLSIITVLALSLSPLRAAQETQSSLPFRLLQDYMIVVRATAGESTKLKVLIDTGANFSVLDKRIAKKMGLKAVGRKYRTSAFGKKRTLGRVILPGLRVGPVFTSLPCLVDDLSWLGLDAIIGLDLLRRRSLSIDFESRVMSFGNPRNLGSLIPLEVHSSLVVVPVQVSGHELSLAVDTGALRITLFEDRVRHLKERFRVVGRPSIIALGSKLRVTEVALTEVRMGQTGWQSHNAFLLESTSDNGVDGVLGLASLNLKRVHFDFVNRLLSWEP